MKRVNTDRGSERSERNKTVENENLKKIDYNRYEKYEHHTMKSDS